jgi:hypothetical protein
MGISLPHCYLATIGWGVHRCTTFNSTMAMFADDTAVMAVAETVENSTRRLQLAVNKFAIWAKEMANKTQ